MQHFGLDQFRACPRSSRLPARYSHATRTLAAHFCEVGVRAACPKNAQQGVVYAGCLCLESRKSLPERAFRSAPAFRSRNAMGLGLHAPGIRGEAPPTVVTRYRSFAGGCLNVPIKMQLWHLRRLSIRRLAFTQALTRPSTDVEEVCNISQPAGRLQESGDRHHRLWQRNRVNGIGTFIPLPHIQSPLLPRSHRNEPAAITPPCRPAASLMLAAGWPRC